MFHQAATTIDARHLELRWQPPPRFDKEDNETIVASNTKPRWNQQKEMLRDRPTLNEASTAPSSSQNRSLAIRNNTTSGGNPRPLSTHIIPLAAPYKLGQAADARDIVCFQSREQAHETLPKLPIGTPLFVKRSNREWTYARIVSYRRPDCSVGDNDLHADDYWNEGKENFIVVVLNEDHSMRKFIGKNKWYSCVRLVRLGVRVDHDVGFVRHNSQPNQHQLDPIITRRSSVPQDVHSLSDHVDVSVATSSAVPQSSVQSHSVRRRSVSEAHYYRQNSKPESRASHHPVVLSLSGSRGSISEGRHSDQNSEHGSLTIAMRRVASEPPTEDDDEESVASTAAVERRSFQTEPNSHVRPADDLASSRCFPTTSKNITDSPATASSFSSSPPNLPAIDLSPAKVNLNARHFCGKRRDRMRPMKRRQSIA